MCRYMSKNVDICVDFGRYVPIYVEKCRYLSILDVDLGRYVSIYVEKVDICVDYCLYVPIYQKNVYLSISMLFWATQAHRHSWTPFRGCSGIPNWFLC